jgi:alkylation response protein AidB-like acyl-CoA dehydrogenase
MRFSFSAEQEEFRTTLRRALEARSPTKEVRRLMATEAGFERESWQKLNQELGLTGIHIPEAYGGQGFGFGELGIVLEEMGRNLLCAPYFSTAALAATAILNAGTEGQKKALLPGLADGTVTATLAFPGGERRHDAASIATTASPSGATWRLDGTKSFVLDGTTADLIVVVARRRARTARKVCPSSPSRAMPRAGTRRKLQVMDETRKLAQLTFKSAEARLLGPEGAAAGPLAKTLQQALVCLANEMVGGADRLREDALRLRQDAHAVRPLDRLVPDHQEQGGRHAGPTSSLRKSAAYYAAAALDEGDNDMPALASLAKASAAEAYLQTAIHAVQMHGGIGFTWDNDTHLWFKRAKSSEILFGDANQHREKMLQAWAH